MVRFQQGERDIFFVIFPDRLCGPPLLIYNGHFSTFTAGKKGPFRELTKPPSNVEVKSEYSQASGPLPFRTIRSVHRKLNLEALRLRALISRTGVLLLSVPRSPQTQTIPN